MATRVTGKWMPGKIPPQEDTANCKYILMVPSGLYRFAWRERGQFMAWSESGMREVVDSVVLWLKLPKAEVDRSQTVEIVTKCENEYWSGFGGSDASGGHPTCYQEIRAVLDLETDRDEDGNIMIPEDLCPRCGKLVKAEDHDWRVANGN